MEMKKLFRNVSFTFIACILLVLCLKMPVHAYSGTGNGTSGYVPPGKAKVLHKYGGKTYIAFDSTKYDYEEIGYAEITAKPLEIEGYKFSAVTVVGEGYEGLGKKAITKKGPKSYLECFIDYDWKSSYFKFFTDNFNSLKITYYYIPEDQEVVPAEVISLSHKKLTLAKGKSFSLAATLNPINSTDVVSWTSSKPKNVSVDDNGKVKALKAGSSAVITAQTSSGKKVSCKITVPKKEIKAKKIKLNKKNITLKAGSTFKIKPTLSPKKTTDNVVYSSNKKEIATVDNTGTVTAVNVGKAVVTAKTTSGKKAKIRIVVE